MRTNIEIDDELMKKAIRAVRNQDQEGCGRGRPGDSVRLDAQAKALRDCAGSESGKAILEQSRLEPL